MKPSLELLPGKGVEIEMKKIESAQGKRRRRRRAGAFVGVRFKQLI